MLFPVQEGNSWKLCTMWCRLWVPETAPCAEPWFESCPKSEAQFYLESFIFVCLAEVLFSSHCILPSLEVIIWAGGESGILNTNIQQWGWDFGFLKLEWKETKPMILASGNLQPYHHCAKHELVILYPGKNGKFSAIAALGAEEFTGMWCLPPLEGGFKF